MVHMTSGILYIMRKRLVAFCARGAYLKCTTIASSLPRLHVLHNIVISMYWYLTDELIRFWWCAVRY